MLVRATLPILAFAAFCGWSGFAVGQAEKKIALVVGNGAYAEAPLKNPPNDARAMAQALRSRGFDVILRENTTKTQLNDAVADFGEKLTEGSTGLFFFAGHGMQVQGRNYLLPIDAKITSEQRVRLETLDVEAVLDQMAAARARVSMLILDACRNNPFERRFRSVGGGLAQINAPEGTLIAYATSPGKVAADGDGTNGLYTQEFLKALTAPGLKVEDVFKQVRVNVSKASNGLQVPWEASSLTGDFYFTGGRPAAGGGAAAAAPAPAQAAPVDREAMFWDTIKNSNQPSEYRAYLEQYPKGSFAALARTKIANLEGAAAPATRAEPAPRPAAAAPAQVAALPPGSASIPTDFRAPAIGTRVTQSTGGVLTVRSVDGTTVRLITNSGRPVEFYGGFVGWLSPERPLPADAVNRLYPLAAGKRVDFSIPPPQGEGATLFTVTVLRRESLTISAGTFDCFVIEIRQRGARSDFEVAWLAWYAPEIGLVVKRAVETVHAARDIPPGWELTRIEHGR